MGSSLRQRSFAERFRKCLRISLTFLFSQVGLMAVVVAYSAAGAVLFEWLEADQEIEPRRKILTIRMDCLNRFRRLAGDGPLSNETDWSIKAASLLKGFENQVVKATKEEGYDGKEVDDAERQWSVSGALLYSITVITTIGYGNLAPKTGPGKVVTIIYALIGIPLMLLCLSNLGSFMASSFQFAFGKIYCCFWCSSRRCCCDRRRRRLRHPTLLPPLIQQPGIVLNSRTVADPAVVVVVASRPPLVDNNKPIVVQQQHPKDDVVVCHQSDLVELTERDYDIVQPADTIASVLDRRYLQQQQQQQHYGMERLNQDARSVLADCSQYCSDSSSSNNNNNKMEDGVQMLTGSPDDWADGHDPADSSAAAETGRVPEDVNHAVKQQQQQQQPPQQQQQHHGQTRVPVSVVLAFLVGYICLGAAVFSAWEEWSYLDGAYFSFITLSTIGFGDLVPGSKVLEQGQTKLVACIIYLVVGLAMIAMSFNLVQEEVITQFQKLGQNMGILDEK